MTTLSVLVRRSSASMSAIRANLPPSISQPTASWPLPTRPLSNRPGGKKAWQPCRVSQGVLCAYTAGSCKCALCQEDLVPGSR